VVAGYFRIVKRNSLPNTRQRTSALIPSEAPEMAERRDFGDGMPFGAGQYPDCCATGAIYQICSPRLFAQIIRVAAAWSL
jgi:hypothetical protein